MPSLVVAVCGRAEHRFHVSGRQGFFGTLGWFMEKCAIARRDDHHQKDRTLGHLMRLPFSNTLVSE
jgi:hypothetical protein